MAKVFISQPMKGKSLEQIRQERADFVAQLESEGHIVIDSVHPTAPDPNNPHEGLWYLGESFKILSTADICYFMKGWENARGCMMEHEACKQYDIEVRYQPYG